MDLMKDLHEEGATICMVTHDPRYAEFSERTIHLFDGRIVEDEEHAEKAIEELRESGWEIA
jgi:putative ABC transport system ATP-binding protein